MNNPQVTRFRLTLRGDTLVVNYADGHTATWQENRGSWRSRTAINFFRLERSGCTAVLFHSQHQYPPNTDAGNGFITVAAGYSLERIVSYWQAADDHITGWLRSLKPLPEHVTPAWTILRYGAKDLEEIRTGRWPLPSS